MQRADGHHLAVTDWVAAFQARPAISTMVAPDLWSTLIGLVMTTSMLLHHLLHHLLQWPVTRLSAHAYR